MNWKKAFLPVFIILPLVIQTYTPPHASSRLTAHLVPWICGDWFLSGFNVPWHDGAYGADFGTVEEWGNYHAYDPLATAEMYTNLHAAGLNSLRWWVFTDGRGAPEFDSNSGGGVTGLDANFLPSLESAIQLAAQHDVYLIFNLWDFGMLDDEDPGDGEHAGGHSDLIVDNTKRQSFINNALIPMLQHPIAGTPYTVGTHPNVIAWDIINEPEWGIVESGAVNPDISNPVTLAQMQRFVAEVAAAIHQYSNQQVTMGSASLKWNSDTALGATANWWSDADLQPFAATGTLDFYQVHYYGWMNGDEITWSYSPLFVSAADAGLDKPTVIGEMPLNAVDLGVTLAQALDMIYANGYAGVWLWSYEDDGSGIFGTWPLGQATLQAFNLAHLGETAVTNQCPSPTTFPDDTADRVLGQPDFNSSSAGTSATQLHGPAGVAVAGNGRFFVVDYENHRVLSWPDAATFINGAAADLVLGQPDFDSAAPGSDDNSLNHPESIAIDSQGTIYVADTENQRIVVYSPPYSNGMAAALTFGSLNPNANCANPTLTVFCFPRGLDVDGQDRLYLADEFHGRVLIYDAPISHDTVPELVIPNLADPRDVAVDAAGNVFVTDSENDRVLGYDTPLTTDTVPDYTFGSISDGVDCFSENDDVPITAERLACPVDLAVDGAGNLYISDLYNHRVLAYADPLNDALPDTVYGQAGGLVTGDANHGGLSARSMNTPLGLAVDGAGTLFLADFGNNRVLGFEPLFSSAIYLPLVVR